MGSFKRSKRLADAENIKREACHTQRNFKPTNAVIDIFNKFNNIWQQDEFELNESELTAKLNDIRRQEENTRIRQARLAERKRQVALASHGQKLKQQEISDIVELLRKRRSHFTGWIFEYLLSGGASFIYRHIFLCHSLRDQQVTAIF